METAAAFSCSALKLMPTSQLKVPRNKDGFEVRSEPARNLTQVSNFEIICLKWQKFIGKKGQLPAKCILSLPDVENVVLRQTDVENFVKAK